MYAGAGKTWSMGRRYWWPWLRKKGGARVAVRRHSADERRELVIEAARREFALRGLGGATGEGLSYRAGISHPYLLRLFGSKRELFLEVVERLFDQLQAAARSASSPESDADSGALTDALREALGEHGPSLLLQAFAACGEDEVRLTVQRRLGELCGSLERAASTPRAKADSLIAQLLLEGAADAMHLQQIAGREPWARRLLETSSRA
jgi:AcrR family transcriptional regulator